MCGGGGGGGDAAAEQRKQEEERQQRIEQGKAQLERIFAGLEGNQYRRPETPRTRVEDVSAPIWEQQQEAYLDFANPQLDNQYKDARKDLGFALARQGINASSTAGDRWGKLQEDYNLQQQAIADKAMGYANQAKSNIADEKQSLLTMLNSTADPGSAVSAARSAVNSLSSTPSFSPLGPLFQNATAGLAAGMQGNQQFKQNEKLNNIMYGGDPDRGSGKIVGGN